MIRLKLIDQHRTRFALGMIVLCLGGCVETGDFGRRHDPSLSPGIRDDLQPFRATTISSLTEDERALRMRVFALVRSPRPPQLAGLVPLPDEFDRTIGPDPDRYFTTLAQSSDRSPYSRFRRLGEDIVSDISLIPEFRVVACRVKAQDRFRATAADAAPSLTINERADLDTRMSENTTLIETTERALPRRIEAYHVALEHLVTASPDIEATRVLHDLDRLKSLVAETTCSSRSRVGLVRKG